jgi:glycosyltransferase involved in cell wall biosynthesis
MSDILNSYIEQKKKIEQLQTEVCGLRWENEQLKSSHQNLISDPYYVQAMDFRVKAKKTVIYKIYRRLRHRKIEAQPVEPTYEQPVNNKEFNYDHMLGTNEYRFLSYKKKRNQWWKININKISVPYKKDMVSIVLPVYNGDDYVELAVESVLAQTYENFELIIVDDGSTDKTPQIVDKYAALDSRVKVIHQENRKLPRTLSRGFREARGEFFTWTSADNIMSPEFLEKFVGDIKKYNHTGMVYGNIRLIDESGNAKTDFGWYSEDAAHPENVMFPKCILDLNTYANNYIGAAFMYRAVVASIVEDYSAYKYGIEDYDYWMKINELFTLRHASFDTPEYSYRMHSKSLTSKDKELKITENRYRQMLLDEFRRDYCLKEVYWIIEADDLGRKDYQELRRVVEKSGSKVITLAQAKQQTDNIYERFIYVAFSNNDTLDIEKIPKTTFKVIVADMPISIEKLEKWDMYICHSEVTERDYLPDYRGWYGIEDVADIMSTVDGKARSRFLYELEADGAIEKDYEKEFSVIISYSGKRMQLEKCIESIACTEDAEVIIVGAPDEIKALEDWNLIECRRVSCITNNDVTRKNVAARVAKGRYLVFVQDDCWLEKEYLKNLSKAFRTNDKIAAVFGNVKVLIGNEQDKYLRLLGEYHIEQDDIYQYSEQNIPSGYSFSIRNDYYKIVGGFYHVNDKWNQLFCDEIMLGMGMMLGVNGYYIYLSSECTVMRLPYEFSEMEITDLLKAAKFAKYHLEINNVLPYNIWPEALEAEKREAENILKDQPDVWFNALKASYDELLPKVRDDFREKEMVDLNRDLFSRLV